MARKPDYFLARMAMITITEFGHRENLVGEYVEVPHNDSKDPKDLIRDNVHLTMQVHLLICVPLPDPLHRSIYSKAKDLTSNCDDFNIKELKIHFFFNIEI